MKKLSADKLANLVAGKRKENGLTQQQLADKTGINRAMISRLEKKNYIPLIPQLEALAEILGFSPEDVFVETLSETEEASKKTEQNNHSTSKEHASLLKSYNIAVAGTGYVGLSIATLLSRHNHVTAVDIIPEKVEMINNRK